jgi:hypothetical protein
MFTGNEPESEGSELRAEKGRVLAQPGPQLVALGHEDHGPFGRRSDDRGE